MSKAASRTFHFEGIQEWWDRKFKMKGLKLETSFFSKWFHNQKWRLVVKGRMQHKSTQHDARLCTYQSHGHASHPKETKKKRSSVSVYWQQIICCAFSIKMWLQIACLQCMTLTHIDTLLSNLFWTLGWGLNKRLGEVHNTYFPLQPESMAPGAGEGIQAV